MNKDRNPLPDPYLLHLRAMLTRVALPISGGKGSDDSSDASSTERSVWNECLPVVKTLDAVDAPRENATDLKTRPVLLIPHADSGHGGLTDVLDANRNGYFSYMTSTEEAVEDYHSKCDIWLESAQSGKRKKL